MEAGSVRLVTICGRGAPSGLMTAARCAPSSGERPKDSLPGHPVGHTPCVVCSCGRQETGIPGGLIGYEYRPLSELEAVSLQRAGQEVGTQ